MAARRAIDVARLCAAWTEHVGDPVLASCRPPHNGEGIDHIKKLVQAIADPWYEMGAPDLRRNKAGNLQWYGGGNHTRWLSDRDMWDYVYSYWQSGGHDRNLKRLMDQMPDKNREAVRKYLDKRKR